MIVDLDSVDDLDQGCSFMNINGAEHKASFHETIFAQTPTCERFSRNASWLKVAPDNVQKISAIAIKNNRNVQPCSVEGKVGIEAKWGGKEGTEVNIYAEGKVEDSNGNYVEGKVEQSSSGEGSGSVSAGHEEK